MSKLWYSTAHNKIASRNARSSPQQMVRYDSFPSNSMLPHIFNPKSTTLLLILLVKKATYGQNHRLVPCSSMIQKPIWRYLKHIKSIQISLFMCFHHITATCPAGSPSEAAGRQPRKAPRQAGETTASGGWKEWGNDPPKQLHDWGSRSLMGYPLEKLFGCCFFLGGFNKASIIIWGTLHFHVL